MAEDLYQVKIPIFEGPLDLLLHLIRKNEVDIYDIPIAEITAQYVGYVEMMEALNIELAGEFLVMAATLIQIKSRMLLPSELNAEDGDDPRLEIARPLLEYIKFKEAAQHLGQRPWLDRDTFNRGATDEIEPPQQEALLFNLGLFDLLDAFKEVMDNFNKRSKNHTVRVGEESVSNRITLLIDRFRDEKDIPFSDLFIGDRTRSELVVTFLAVLELARMGFIFIVQETIFGPIRVKVRPEAFDLDDDLDERTDFGEDEEQLTGEPVETDY